MVELGRGGRARQVCKLASLLSGLAWVAVVSGCSAEPGMSGSSSESGSLAESTEALSTSTPFNSPIAIPGGFLFAPDYDNGGEGVAYHDTDPVDQGAATGSTFRTSEGVDVEGTASFPANGDHVGWTAAGEWLGYTVEVKNSGVFSVTASVAAPAAGGAFHLVAGGAVVGAASVPATGGWQTFQDLTISNVHLNAGVQILRFVEDSGGFNFRSLTFATSTPFSNAPSLVPGTIQAYNYDDGGEGVAYHDVDTVDQGTSTGCTFRTGEGVDVEGTAATPAAPADVGWTNSGEWLNYTVDVLKTGTYTVTASVAAAGAGSAFHLLDGATNLGSVAVPNTGSWTAFQNVALADVTLNAGFQTLQVAADAGGFNLATLVIAPKSNLIKNGNFAQGLSGWNTYVDSHTTSGTTVTAQTARAQATILAGASYQDWYVQLYQGGLPLVQGQSYRLSFDVSGCAHGAGGQLNAVVEHDGAPYTQYFPSTTVSIPDCQTTRHSVFDFVMSSPTDAQSRVTFNMGLDTAWQVNTLNISNVTLSQNAFGNPNLVGHIAGPSICSRGSTCGKIAMPGIAVNLSGAQSASTVTDANGNYRFQVPPGSYTVSAATPSGSSFAAASQSLPSLVGDATADFTCTGPCGAATNIIANKELVITDPSVLADARASSASAVAGPWSFRAMMEQLAPVGTDPADFVGAWLDTFGNTNAVVNGFALGSRDTSALRALWPTTANGKLDLTRPPFQLLAIVNRLDVGAQGNGEARFVYGLGSGTGMTVIFEYGLPSSDITNGSTLTRASWANKFHALGSQPFGASYNAALQAVTDLFTLRGTSPNKPGGSSIDQVRTSENLMNPATWQWRQYQLTTIAGGLALTPGLTGQTPTDAAGFQGTAESLVMISHLNTNPVLLHGGYIDVPSGVIGGASDISRFSWGFPGAVVVENARHNFAGMTCNGCHTLEAQGLQLDNFYQISPLSPGGADGTGRLSPFIKQFEIPRRQMFLQNRLTCAGASCAAGGEAMFIQ